MPLPLLGGLAAGGLGLAGGSSSATGSTLSSNNSKTIIDTSGLVPLAILGLVAVYLITRKK